MCFFLIKCFVLVFLVDNFIWIVIVKIKLWNENITLFLEHCKDLAVTHTFAMISTVHALKSINLVVWIRDYNEKHLIERSANSSLKIGKTKECCYIHFSTVVKRTSTLNVCPVIDIVEPTLIQKEFLHILHQKN